jgi:hypothetical protein
MTRRPLAGGAAGMQTGDDQGLEIAAPERPRSSAVCAQLQTKVEYVG